jgi:hypothetical protein
MKTNGLVVGITLTLTVILNLAAVERLFAQEPSEIRTERERIEQLEREIDELREALARQDSVDVEQLRRQIDAITRELEQMQLGQEVVVADTGSFGLGPAASKVYRIEQGVSLGGYGEMLYQGFANTRQDGSTSGRRNQIDFLRAVLYAGYKFNDRFIFNSEIEFEHASTSESGSVSVEFAYLDWFVSGDVGFRGGLVLAPMGFINELHEPTTFLGTTRPETELRIIPTTWRENGIGVFAQPGDFALRGYVMNSLDAVGDADDPDTGFSETGLRGGRQKGSKALAENLAFVGRADWLGASGLQVGTSAFFGNTGQSTELASDPAQTLGAFTVIWDVHAQLRVRGWDLRGLVAVSWVDEVAELNEIKGLTGDESVGERLVGWYVQAGYDVLRTVDTQVQLLPFVRYERINTQDRVPAGWTTNPARDRAILSVGAQVLPIYNIVLKTDYQFVGNAADTGVNKFNVSLGYIF